MRRACEEGTVNVPVCFDNIEIHLFERKCCVFAEAERGAVHEDVGRC